MSRCKIHIHEQKNAGKTCFMCKAGLNRTAKTVQCGSKTVEVCRRCKDKNNL